MSETVTLSRRTLLYSSAVAAGAVMLGACTTDGEEEPAGGGGGAPGSERGKGSAVKALTPPSEFKEAPMLAAKVKAGDLPPVEERLPKSPYVIPHKWCATGKYGGNLLMMTEHTSGTGSESNREYMYGHSPLRWLNDGLNIGPGLVESWEQNDDASEWTLHFREGLKWSDGEPWTTADIMFWWEDVVLNEDHTEVPPDEARSGKGTLAKFEAVDDITLRMTFDAPAPLTADRLAMWVNGSIGNGPRWMAPKHYAEQFHPKYNKSAPKDWAAEGGSYETNVDFSKNPKCPTMTGWMVKSIREGRNLIWERNPYYWVVDKDGNQLPYLDQLTMTAVQDPEVGKLQAQEGKLDYVQGQFSQVLLPDISTFKKAEGTSGMDVILWDGGSGTSSMFFFNYDHKDEKFRALIREPKFRQALSLAVNRAEIKKAIYFETGELTTGTLSPKAKEYLVNDDGKQVYADWRDAYVKYDPDQAKALLDELGVEDKDGDGMREMPDGSKLTVRLDHPADADDEHQQKNNYLIRDWKAIGIKATQNPVSPEAWDNQWQSGSLTANSAWEVGDGPNHLVYPQWLVPLEPSRWAPLEGQWYNVRGTPEANKELDTAPYDRTPPRMEPEEGGPIAQLWETYDQSKVEPDEMKRHQLVWDMIKIHIESGPFFMGVVANTPRVILARKELKNVPRKEHLALGGFANPWIHPTPAIYDPETYFWDNPDDHAV